MDYEWSEVKEKLNIIKWGKIFAFRNEWKGTRVIGGALL